MNARMVLAAAIAAVAALTGCSGDDDTTAQAGPTTTAPVVRKLDATQVAKRLAALGMPVSGIVTTTEDNDPNDMLGRQGGYLSRATFRVPGAEETGKQETTRGGSIEVWPTAEAAVQRWEYLRGFQGGILGDGYDYVFGPVVLRIAKEVKPSVAEPFEAALRPAVAP